MVTARISVFAVVFALPMVQAAPLTFFSEDLNGNPNARVAFPNSSMARANFLSQLSTSANDSLEELAGGTLVPFSLTFSGMDTAAVSAANGSIQSVPSGTDGFGRYPTSGNNFFETNAASTSLVFTNAVSAFGFYGIDVGAFGGQLSLRLGFAAGGSSTIMVPHAIGTGNGSPPDGSVLFFGYIDAANPFITVQLLDSSGSDTFGFDDFVIGIPRQVTVTPEPCSISLLLAGVLGLVVTFRNGQKRPAESDF